VVAKASLITHPAKRFPSLQTFIRRWIHTHAKCLQHHQHDHRLIGEATWCPVSNALGDESKVIWVFGSKPVRWTDQVRARDN
jgi:hypothetical protein